MTKNNPQPSSLPAGQSDENDLRAARRVLSYASEALTSLAGSLDGAFTEAVTTLFQVRGRVIVSGMGKSGHVARKTAATLASTGTPAQFVHPAEASHGDLGMITRIDAVLMLSNSGENRELSDLIAHTRRFSIPLIAISSKADSTLMRAADTKLLLPEAPEACPMGMAPTTSSTMMIALGDALAVALMERRGFSKDDYRVLHPGGKLGQSLIRVNDIMHKGDAMPLVAEEADLKTVIAVMTEKGFGASGVVDGAGALTGIITDGDLRRHLSGDLMGKRAADIMTRNPKTIRQSALAAEAVNFMNSARPPFMCLFVVREPGDGQAEERRPVGILHMHDCLRAGLG